MVQRNYQKELDKLLLEEAQKPGLRRVLLHSCCAPCSSSVLSYLAQHFLVTVFYYNPNIEPQEEYRQRCMEQERLLREMPLLHPADFWEGAYEPARFHQACAGMESLPEGGARCRKCCSMRLQETARLAAENGFDYFTTTLSISPLKNARMLNEEGERAAEIYGVRYLPSDFKKRGGYQESIRLSKEYGLYRQNYCGCVFSKRARQEQEEKNHVCTV